MSEYLQLGYIVGYFGVIFGMLVPIPQLIKIFRTKSLKDISLTTYLFLCVAISCYLIHAIYIESIVFTVAQSINLSTNATILVLLIRRR